ncbi:MAG: hypothetical protein NVS3B20_01150 [Polyangiales bacterium]
MHPSSSESPDRLAVGEAPKGLEKAFDLVLPRGSTVQRQFANSIYATVPLSGEALADEVRRQATVSPPIVGPERTLFVNVQVNGTSRDHHLRVEIACPALSDGSSLIVDRIEERPPEPPLSPTEAMRKVGLTPDGKLIDPKHLD